MHAILSVGILMSAGSTGIATPHLFYSLIFLGSLVWITEGLDKVKSINHVSYSVNCVSLFPPPIELHVCNNCVIILNLFSFHEGSCIQHNRLGL